MLDFFFAGEKGDPTAIMIAIKDCRSKALHAYLLDSEEANHKVVSKIAQWIDSLGYKRVIIKSAREPAIVSVQDKVRAEAKTETVPENSPKGESQSNGQIESGIRELMGMIRTLKDDIETKTKEPMENNSPMLAWIVEAAGTMISRYRVGKDCKTAYQRLKGKAPPNKVVAIGERVLCLPLKSAGKRNKLAPKFKFGV